MIIKLDKERELKFVMSTVKKLEDIIKEPFLKVLQDFIEVKNVTTDRIMTILWAALIHNDKDLTLEGLYDIFDNLDEQIPFNDLLQSLKDPVTVFFAGGKEKNVKRPNPGIVKRKIPSKKKN